MYTTPSQWWLFHFWHSPSQVKNWFGTLCCIQMLWKVETNLRLIYQSYWKIICTWCSLETKTCSFCIKRCTSLNWLLHRHCTLSCCHTMQKINRLDIPLNDGFKWALPSKSTVSHEVYLFILTGKGAQIQHNVWPHLATAWCMVQLNIHMLGYLSVFCCFQSIISAFCGGPMLFPLWNHLP